MRHVEDFLLELGAALGCGMVARMLHHISLAVADLDRAAVFYDAVLAPLGYGRVWTAATAVGYGRPGGGDRLALKLRPDRPAPAPSGLHVAFAAPDRVGVEGFHRAALAHGGVDRGAPGLRPHFGPGYFAAFVLDLDGYWLEAVVRVGGAVGEIGDGTGGAGGLG